MPRETFERELHHLHDEILVLGSMVEQAVLDSVDALRRRDQEASKRIYRDDSLINEKRFEIENSCLVLIATQQPMARDLRALAAIMEINTELERIGDYAKGISRINVLLGKDPLIIPVTDLVTMAEKALSMLHRSLGAFVARDADAAKAISAEDDEIDKLYNHIYRELVNEMIANPANIDHANFLVWVIHNLERLGDRVTNICERTVFVVTGEMHELDVANDSLMSRGLLE